VPANSPTSDQALPSLGTPVIVQISGHDEKSGGEGVTNRAVPVATSVSSPGIDVSQLIIVVRANRAGNVPTKSHSAIRRRVTLPSTYAFKPTTGSK
jgi:hypothetical protein